MSTAPVTTAPVPNSGFSQFVSQAGVWISETASKVYAFIAQLVKTTLVFLSENFARLATFVSTHQKEVMLVLGAVAFTALVFAAYQQWSKPAVTAKAHIETVSAPLPQASG